jgi:UDPglucose 6-dehydrogenase
MKLVVIGTGYVGLISGLCFAEFGFETICVDTDNDKLDKLKKGKPPFFEPGLDELLLKHIKSTKRFSLSNNLRESLKDANVVFITVGTPTRRLEDEADLRAVYKVAEEIAENIQNYCVIVTKSTVPVGTTREVQKIVSSKINKDKFDIVSNPEFLREGSAINDFMRPDRVVIGAENKRAEKIIRELYRPLYLLETPIVVTSIESAEIIKYASNSFLATKIAFINQVADLCEAVGANVQDVAKAMGIDRRIGSKFLNTGPGYGGSCLPKDLKAFSATAKKLNVDFSIIDAVTHSNEERPGKIVAKILNRYNNNVKGKIFSILGLSFKPNTNDVRDSISLKIANMLIKKGTQVKSFDPKAMTEAKKILPEVIYCNSIKEVCKDADGLIIATEWNEFRALDFKAIKEVMKNPIIFDLHNIYNKEELVNLNFEYHGIGK